MTRRRKYLLLLMPVSLALLLWLMLASNWGLSLGLRIASAVMPGELSVSENHGSLLGPIRLRGLRYHNDQLTLSIQKLDLDWHAFSLLSGKLAISRLAVNEVSIAVLAGKAQGTTQQTAIVLPIALDVEQASLNKLSIKTADTAAPIIIDHVSLNARANQQNVEIQQVDIQAYRTQGKLSGELSLSEHFPMKLAIDFTYQADATHRLSGRGNLTGDLRKLHLTQKLSGLIQANVVAEATDLPGKLQWHGQADVARLDLHDVFAKIPEIEVQGKLTAKGDRHALHVESQLQVENKRIGLAHLNLNGDSDLLFSDYRFTADGDFTGVDLPPAKLTLQGKGNRQQVDVAQLQVHALKGDAQGHARVSWQPRLAVNASLDIHNLQTGALSKDWPGQLSGQLSLQSEPDAKSQAFRFTLHNLTGKLRGYPVQAEANGVWSEKLLALDKVQLNVGGTNVTAQGKLSEQWNLSFQAHSDNLNSLLPAAKGKFALTGELSGTPSKPRLRVNGEANQLAYAEQAIGALSLKLDVGLAKDAVSEIDVQAKDVQMRAGHWTTVHVQTTGTNAAQVGTFDANSDGISLQARLHGKFEPWRWQGSLDQFSFKQTRYGEWHLQQPVAIALAKNQIKLSSLCLAQNGSHLCAEGQWDKTHRQARIDGKAVPLVFLEPWIPSNIQLSGELDMQATVTTTPQNTVQAQLMLHSPDKSMVLAFSDVKESLIMGESTLRAELNNKGLHAVLHLPLSDGGGIDSEASLPNWQLQNGLPRNQPVQASVKVNKIPADLVTRFAPDIVRAKGELHADLQVGGTLGRPHLRGSAQWRDGSVLVSQLGINIHDISAELKSAQTNKLAFVLKARSGDGDVQLDGQIRLEPEQGWPTTATLTSHNLEVSNIPEAYILVDSKVQVALQGSTINIEGDLTVPRARLRPHTLPEGTVQASPDVVIIGSKKQTEAATRWLLTSHLQVQLGDQVDFNGFGIRGKLRGKLGINLEPGKLVMGQGEVSIADGTYRMRGQDLTIRRGRLIFSNTFIDDPGLDVEAVRTIDTITAGVRLKGTLKQPQLSVFSEPTMPESDVLAYLILGRPLSQTTVAEGQAVSNTASALGFVAGDFLEKGIGGTLGLDELRVDVDQTTQSTALVIGKYLSPKLYLRYYSGIAEASRIVQLQYQLSKRIQIQTESGYRGSQSITGGDIFFTIEY